MKYETRMIFADEVRFAADETGKFSGYASVWDSADSYGDVIRKGAFAKTIKRMRPALLWQHDPGQPIGKWTSVSEDERGLRVEGKLVLETRQGAEALALLRADALNGLSIGFRTLRSERGPNGGRIITEIELPEVSLVTMPAATKARVDSVKSALPADVAAFVEAARRAAAILKGQT
ncbi:MAG: HK97 family phage prohead protease [Hyphomonadaceae bacterium]